MSNKTRAPADGERNALLGYGHQYQVAAELIYDALLDGTFEWVKLLSTTAGRVDDVQIATRGRIDAYQIKWSKYSKPFTFNSLISKRSGQPCLFEQLADGWKKLSEQYKDKIVVVHFLTNDLPSSKDSVIGTPANIAETHFYAFIRNCWPLRKYWFDQEKWSLDKNNWQTAIDKLVETTSLNTQEFQRFIEYCELDFSYVLTETNAFGKNVRRTKDIEALKSILLSLASSGNSDISLSRLDLLSMDNWGERFEFKFKHDFVVDELIYQPVQSTVNELNKGIAGFNSGYIALIGTPGSGKSTTLTQTFKYRENIRVIRYYAYIRDDANLGRGEAYAFLHDMVIALYRDGIRPQKREFPESREELLAFFSEQLALLGEDWQKNGTKTLVLVDGLDHIEREQKPIHTLVSVLPLPDQIPAGVVFLIGSQKIGLAGISPRVETHLDEPGRTITMRPLEREAIYTIVQRSKLRIALSHPQIERTCSLCGGHPLALGYLIERLRIADTNEEIDKILDEVPEFSGNIENEYRVYWDSISNEPHVRHLLGLVCRLRGELDLEEILRWDDEEVIRRFIKTAHQYFYKENESRWYVFHNSFRQYLLLKTAETPLGKYDKEKDCSFHGELAAFAQRDNVKESWSWEEVYHRYKAGDLKSILGRINQEHFRNQFAAFRPQRDIKNDLELCIKAARDCADPLAFVRALFIEAELDTRNTNIEGEDLSSLFVDLFGVEQALAMVIRGRELLVSEEEALRVCKELVRIGSLEEARSLFNAAEPMALLSSIEPINHVRDDIELLELWIRVAHIFRPIQQILAAVWNLKLSNDGRFKNYDVDIREIRIRLIGVLIDSLYLNVNKNIAEDILKLLENDADYESYLQRFNEGVVWDAINNVRPLADGIKALNQLAEYWDSCELDDDYRLYVASLVFKLTRDPEIVGKYLDDVLSPLNREYRAHGNRAMEELEPCIRYARLHAALGHNIDAARAVIDPEDDRDVGTVLFKRMLIKIATVQGVAWAGKQLSEYELISILKPALVLFNRSHTETNQWIYWHSFHSSRTEYFKFILQAAALHGNNALNSIMHEIECQWNDPNDSKYWHTDLKRDIALYHFRISGDRATFKMRLSKLNPEDDDLDSPSGLLLSYKSHMRALLALGDVSNAQTWFKKMRLASYGVRGQDDDQLMRWLRWAGRANHIDEKHALDRLLNFIIAQRTLKELNYSEFGYELLKEICKYDVGTSIEIRNYLLRNEGVSLIDSTAGIISGILQRHDVPAEEVLVLVINLIIPYQKVLPIDLAVRLGEIIARKYPQNYQQLLQKLLTAADTKAYNAVSQYWRANILTGVNKSGADTAWMHDINNVETNEKESADEEIDEKPAGVQLKNKSFVDQTELAIRLAKPSDAFYLIENTAKSIRISWGHLLLPHFSNYSSSQLATLISILDRNHSEHDCYIDVASELKKRGETQIAIEVLHEGLKSVRRRGWDRYYDGGAKIDIATALIDLDSVNGRVYIIKNMINDYLSEYRDPVSFLRNLSEIAELIFNEIPVLKIWDEIYAHVSALNEIRLSHNKPIIRDIRGEQSSLRGIYKLIEEASASSVSDMRESARQALCDLSVIKAAQDELIEYFKARLNSRDQDAVLEALATLELIAYINTNCVQELWEFIEDHAKSDSIAHRVYVKHISNLIGKKLTASAESNKPLAITYELELPEIKMTDRSPYFEIPQAGEIYPDTDDPLERIRPFQKAFEVLSKISAIPLHNLVLRASNLMLSISPQETWTKEAEKRIRQLLSAQDFSLSYRRVRVVVAQAALAIVIAELLDASIINENSINELLGWVLISDPILDLMIKNQRPNWIPQVKLPSRLNRSDTNWVTMASESLPLLEYQGPNGEVILGESSLYRSDDWDHATEQHISSLCHKEFPDPEAFHNVLLGRDCWRLSDYPDLKGFDSPIPVAVVRGSLRMHGDEWLALNPHLGFYLNWHADSLRPYRWLDENDHTMVDTVRWQKGCMLYHTPFGTNEVSAYGWLVTATADAWELIHEVSPWFCRYGAIKRTIKNEEDGSDNSSWAFSKTDV